MTTYAFPIALYEYTFDALELLLTKINEKLEESGHPTYDTETGRPIGAFANILEIMKEAKQDAHEGAAESPLTISFTLTDYLFFPLQNLLKEKCQTYKDQTGNDPFSPITGEPQFECASMFEATRFAIKSAILNSYSSFADNDSRVKLWSPKQSN